MSRPLQKGHQKGRCIHLAELKPEHRGSLEKYNVQEHAGRPPLENHGARSLLLAPGRPDRLSGGVSGGVVAGVEVEVVVVVVEVEVEVLDEPMKRPADKPLRLPHNRALLPANVQSRPARGIKAYWVPTNEAGNNDGAASETRLLAVRCSRDERRG
ncbi:unnamed protein product [Gadus morhua 'NCC']